MTNTTIRHVSDTALWVAAYRALESQRDDALYQDPLAAKLAGKRGFEIARTAPHGAVTAWIMAVRTVVIDRFLQKAIREGADTVLNLGAGLDTRPYRLDLPKDLSWIEVDFPEPIRQKNEALASETPRCRLSRVGLDLSDRAAAGSFYSEVGRSARKVVVLTEGVVLYLTNEQAAGLADDLRKVPTFKWWIQDYRRNGAGSRVPKNLKKALVNAPFQFNSPDPVAFFAAHGWKERENVLAIEEGERLGRPFPIPFPWSWIAPFLPKSKKKDFRAASGYVMLEAAE